MRPTTRSNVYPKYFLCCPPKIDEVGSKQIVQACKGEQSLNSADCNFCPAFMSKRLRAALFVQCIHPDNRCAHTTTPSLSTLILSSVCLTVCLTGSRSWVAFHKSRCSLEIAATFTQSSNINQSVKSLRVSCRDAAVPAGHSKQASCPPAPLSNPSTTKDCNLLRG